ncbi:hypothetical protein Mmc1_1725 [Magnetococcus marinus MC-1]|uniref:Uncharacterized protein n=1 Tax=Magnetococcus marinus (strain ATCC BAA-1437 / JCM 17883 / MC-1) TaxID=156889 RepID=A0L8E0_MAGMM|nr:hypothetical protein [Magnetococcus marinus]ABK44233.1 hypothetical protein Mmc1_1725 [Magnetococcus marinus MC-1]
MALQLNFTSSRFGVNCPDGYVRIYSFQGDNKRVHCRAGFYASKAARAAGQAPLEEEGFEFDFDESDGDNLLKRLYANIKADPRFALALDV